MAPLTQRHRALGRAIRAARRARELTQEDLGERSGLSANYVGDTERGGRNLSIRALWQISDGLGMEASALLSEAEDTDGGEEG